MLTMKKKLYLHPEKLDTKRINNKVIINKPIDSKCKTKDL
jgi:hypothetical protein